MGGLEVSWSGRFIFLRVDRSDYWLIVIIGTVVLGMGFVGLRAHLCRIAKPGLVPVGVLLSVIEIG